MTVNASNLGSPPKSAANDTPDNSNIKNEATSEPNVQQTKSYVSVLNENIYKFMSNSFSGKGGYRDGSYLIPHNRELFYDARRDLNFYKNYVLPIVSAMVDPVFSKEIERTVTTASGTEMTDGMPVAFLEDVDKAGADMQRFARNVALTAMLHGITFVIVSNDEKTTESTEEAIRLREYPYVYIKKAYQVPKPIKMDDSSESPIGWKTDKFGNIIWITFVEKKIKVKNAAGTLEDKIQYSYWDKDKYFEFYLSSSKIRIIVGEETKFELGKIPVIPVYGGTRENNKNILIDPPLYDIAKTNHAMYNKDSEIRDLERAQGFSVFYSPSSEPGNMNIGAHNVLYPPIDAPFPPGFASPDVGILKGLMENAVQLRDDLFAMANQKGVIGVRSAKSGLALEWEFKAEELILQHVSQFSEVMEDKVMELFALWTGDDFVYNAQYPNTFKPSSNVQDVDLVDKALIMGLPPKAAMILKKMVFKTLVKKESPEDMKEALEQFDRDMEPEVE